MFLNEDIGSQSFSSSGKAESLVIDSANKSISFLSISKVKSKEQFMNEERFLSKNESADNLDELLDEMLDGFETKENKSMEQLQEDSLFFNKDAEIINEGIIDGALKFLMKPLHLSNDTAENQRQFQKLYSQIAATKNLDDEVFSKNCSRILRFVIDAIAKGCISGATAFITSFIPIIGQIAYIWVVTKCMEDTATKVLKENKKVLISAKESFEDKVRKESDPKAKKALQDSLNQINNSINKIEEKITLYEKAKNEDTNIETNNDNKLLDEEEDFDDLFDINSVI